MLLNSIGHNEAELERFGNREIDAKYVKYVWEKLGKELAWEPFTLALYYFEHLEECRSLRYNKQLTINTWQNSDANKYFILKPSK